MNAVASPPAARESGANAGFTLIELLVVFTLLSLFISGVFGAVRFGTRAMDQTVATAEGHQEIETAHRFLRRLLSELGRPGNAGAAGRRPVLIGDTERMSLLASMPRHLAASGRAKVDLLIRRAQRGAALDVTWRPAFPRVAADIPAIATRLADGIAGAEFAYFGDPSGVGSPAWYDRWTVPDRLPALVRVGVVGADGNPWPDLLVMLPRAGHPEMLP